MEIKIDKKVVRLVFIAVLGAIGFYWLLHETERVKAVWGFLLGIFSPFVIGALLAFILNVPLRFFERQLSRVIKSDVPLRLAAIFMTLIALAVMIAAVVMLLIPQIEETVKLLIEQFPPFFRKVNLVLNDIFIRHPELKEMLGLSAHKGEIEWMKIVETVMNFLETSISGVVGSAFTLVTNLAKFIFNAVISVVFAFYCLTRKESLARIGRKLLYASMRESRADEVVRVLRMINTVFSNFITGQSLEAVILALLFVPAMAVMKMPYIPLICVVIAITALVPLVGAFVGCALGAFFILVSNPMQAVYFVIMFLVIQQFEGNVIYPKVVGESIGLPGMWVLLAVAVGGGLMGISGMLLFVPLTSVFYSLMREYAHKRLGEKGVPEEKLVPQPPILQPHFMFKKSKAVKDKIKKRKELKKEKRNGVK